MESPDAVEKSRVFRLRHSAFLLYKVQVQNDLAASFTLSMLGHYSAAEVLLRSCLEYICLGAFLDSIAKKSFGEACSALLGKESGPDSIGEHGSIQRLFDDIECASPGFMDEMEIQSAAVLDKLSVFMPDIAFRRMLPTVRECIGQLERWGFLAPIEEPLRYVYEGGYHLLSLPAHGSIDHIDVGSKLLREEDFLNLPGFDGKRLVDYVSHYNQLLDVCLVVTVHCKLDKVGHRSLCPPRNGTGVVLLEAAMCRVNLKEWSGSSYLSPHSKMSKIVQLLPSCCQP